MLSSLFYWDRKTDKRKEKVVKMDSGQKNKERKRNIRINKLEIAETEIERKGEYTNTREYIADAIFGIFDDVQHNENYY